MRLFLTSSGIESQKLKSYFRKLAGKGLRCLIVANSVPGDKHWHYVIGTMKEVKSFGMKADVFSLNKKISARQLNRYDCVYICGGNTYEILHKMRKTGFSRICPSFVRNGGIYVGVSAGSIIAGPSIAVAGFGCEGDPNIVGLKDLRGFRLTTVSIFPHFRSCLAAEIKKWCAKASSPVVSLADGQAYVEWDGKKKVI